MSTQPQMDDAMSEMANNNNNNRCGDDQVNDAHSMVDNEKGEVNSTDQTESNNRTTTNQTNACNIKMDTIESTIVADLSECSLNGLEKNDVTEVSSVPHGAADANSVMYLPTTTTTATVTATNPSPILLSPCRDTTMTTTSTTTPTTVTTTTIIEYSSDDDFDEIQKLFETKSLAIEKWLRERAPQDVLMKMHAATECVRTPKSPKLRTPSVTSDLFQQWLATSPVQVCKKFVSRKGERKKNLQIEINGKHESFAFTL